MNIARPSTIDITFDLSQYARTLLQSQSLQQNLDQANERIDLLQAELTASRAIRRDMEDEQAVREDEMHNREEDVTRVSYLYGYEDSKEGKPPTNMPDEFTTSIIRFITKIKRERVLSYLTIDEIVQLFDAAQTDMEAVSETTTATSSSDAESAVDNATVASPVRYNLRRN
ncbi:hypothetical protein EW146_g6861 [Bondarzewia mesenterica]|uniref:Uncharacterized protein n=1 Tax=Bondarzewia mesenterica TaxID=1095465 RepID=A0A4V3XEE9_9AGAM|nr:hypothetical protein EW146_g6861 [Bondarzewia mesenterica]